jgi:hypothetical protein
VNAEELIAAYDRYRTSWVRQDWEAFRRVLHPSYTFAIGGVPVGGVMETIEWSTQLLDAFPDYDQVVNAQYPSGSVLVVESVASGTSNGQAPGSRLPNPVPGRRFQLPYVKILRFAEGLIRDDRQYHDGASMTAQLYPSSTLPDHH